MFFGRSEKQNGRPGLWLAETFSTSPLKHLNGIQRNLARSKISTSFAKFVFFEPIGKTRSPPWSLIGRDIFDFFSETADQTSTKLARSQHPLPNLCFLGWSEKQDGRPGLWLAETFSTAEQNSMKLDREQDLNVLYIVGVFRGWLVKQDCWSGLWLAETFWTSLNSLKGIQQNLTESKISTSSTEFVFFMPMSIQK